MSETEVTNVTTLPKPSRKDRILTKTNAKRAAIIAAVLGTAVYVKKRVNATGSASVDVHVETDETNDN